TPMRSGGRIGVRRSRGQGGDRGQGLALEELEEGAAARGDVVDAVAHAELRDGRERVAAARDRVAGGLGHRPGEGLGAAGEGREFEYPDRSVPHDGARLAKPGGEDRKSVV